MNKKKIEALSVFSLFISFLVVLSVAIFFVLLESGIITFQSQSLSIKSFSCTPSGTVINLYKSVGNEINVTQITITTNSNTVSIKSNYVIKGTYSKLYLSYRCLQPYKISIKVYYSSYAYLQNQNNQSNIFLRIISDSRV